MLSCCLREDAHKKVVFLVIGPLESGGGGVKPLTKLLFSTMINYIASSMPVNIDYLELRPLNNFFMCLPLRTLATKLSLTHKNDKGST